MKEFFKPATKNDLSNAADEESSIAGDPGQELIGSKTEENQSRIDPARGEMDKKQQASTTNPGANDATDEPDDELERYHADLLQRLRDSLADGSMNCLMDDLSGEEGEFQDDEVDDEDDDCDDDNDGKKKRLIYKPPVVQRRIHSAGRVMESTIPVLTTDTMFAKSTYGYLFTNTKIIASGRNVPALIVAPQADWNLINTTGGPCFTSIELFG
ncbi:MAG: hypothetical protein SGARI_000277 [Bacillariaceae sp.]